MTDHLHRDGRTMNDVQWTITDLWTHAICGILTRTWVVLAPVLYVNNLLYLLWYLLNHELDVVVPPICLWDLELDWLSYITVGVFSLTPISSPLALTSNLESHGQSAYSITFWRGGFASIVDYG